MDDKYWRDMNPKVALVNTTKQFFGKYLYKIDYALPSALFINRTEEGMIAHCIASRKAMAGKVSDMNYNNYWVRGISDKTDAVMLEHFALIKRKHTLKYRLDNYSLMAYANDEAPLRAFSDDVLLIYQHLIKEVSRPKNAATRILLEDGHILGVHRHGYAYKVLLCDGKFEPAAKIQLVSYLDGLGSEVVHINNATRTAFSSPNRFYSYGNYIYTNDITILSFVSLICPGLVGKIYELTKI